MSVAISPFLLPWFEQISQVGLWGNRLSIELAGLWSKNEFGLRKVFYGKCRKSIVGPLSDVIEVSASFAYKLHKLPQTLSKLKKCILKHLLVPLDNLQQVMWINILQIADCKLSDQMYLVQCSRQNNRTTIAILQLITIRNSSFSVTTKEFGSGQSGDFPLKNFLLW